MHYKLPYPQRICLVSPIFVPFRTLTASKNFALHLQISVFLYADLKPPEGSWATLENVLELVAFERQFDNWWAHTLCDSAS